MAEILEALEAHEDLDWSQASDLLVPVMPRVRPFPPGTPPPLQTLAGPGIAVGFGIDVGPAFLVVTTDLARQWNVSAIDLLARAISNLHTRAQLVEPTLIYRGQVESMPTEWLQTGQSIGSTLVLAPAELRRIFGSEPRLFITPMRDLIIGLPIDCSRDLALWLHSEIASGDPNCLGPTAYRFDGRLVVPEPLDLGDLSPQPVAPPTPFFAA